MDREMKEQMNKINTEYLLDAKIKYGNFCITYLSAYDIEDLHPGAYKEVTPQIICK